MIIGMDGQTNEFTLHDASDFEKRFPGTVQGAIDLQKYLIDNKVPYVSMSSDLNHPDEYPGFEPFAIDIAAGEYEGAIEAGVIVIEFASDCSDGGSI